MPDSMMYQEDYFVVLEPNLPEQFLTPEELLTKLENVIREHRDSLPREVAKFATVTEQAAHLMQNYCDFDLDSGDYLQWYAVRLEK